MERQDGHARAILLEEVVIVRDFARHQGAGARVRESEDAVERFLASRAGGGRVEDQVGHATEVIHRTGFAPAERRWRYPLPLPGTLHWRRREGALAADVELPPVPAEHLILPSFAALGSPDHHCVLIDGEARAVTAGSGRPGRQHEDMPGGSARVCVDCFETSGPLTGTRLRFRVNATTAPADYLAVVSIRPRRTAVRPPHRADTPVLPVPPRTQMAEPAALGPRICSPTCVSMALDHLEVRHEFHELVVAAYHRPTDLYGVWPQNVWAASRWGVLGAAEATAGWDTARRMLDAGHPFVASIAFGEGALSGAPLAASPGHLVIVRGIQNNRVLVNDPAAPKVADVPHSYDIEEFQEAWLAERGVFYAFAKRP